MKLVIHGAGVRRSKWKEEGKEEHLSEHNMYNSYFGNKYFKHSKIKLNIGIILKLNINRNKKNLVVFQMNITSERVILNTELYLASM